MLSALPGVNPHLPGSFFHECALELPAPASIVIEALLDRDILAGLDLGSFYPGMDNVLLVCATEKRTEAEMIGYRDALAEVLEQIDLPAMEAAS